MITLISLFEIISAVVPNLKTFFWIAASVANAAAVTSNYIKTSFASGGSTFFINGKPTIVNEAKNSPF